MDVGLDHARALAKQWQDAQRAGAVTNAEPANKLPA
jgi:hypothetical protein